jgi:hypothetical protein
MHVHVEEERHLDAIAPRVSFGDRQSQQREPRNDRQSDYATRHQVRRIAAKMHTPQELKKRSPEDQREIRRFWRERFYGFGFHELGMLSLSILGVGTLVKGGLFANFKSTLVRPLESIAEIQLQLQLPLLSLSAMLSEYFTRVIFSPFFSPRQ